MSDQPAPLDLDPDVKLSLEEKEKLDQALAGLDLSRLIDHPQWLESAKACIHAYSPVDPGCISALVGPSGVGKSALMRTLANHLWNKLSPNTTKDKPGKDIPVVLLPAKASETGPFSWRDLYKRILEITNPPYMADLFGHPTSTGVYGRRTTDGDLRREVERSFKLRNTKVFMLDEANHVSLGKSAKNLQRTLDVVKSFGETAGVHLILAGPYELLTAAELNPQLLRRTTIIHFPRYRPERTTHVGSLRDAMCMWAECLAPWKFEIDLEAPTREEMSYFFQRSLGCVGILRDWFVRALVESKTYGSWIVTKKHLDATARTTAQLNIILTEIESAENRWCDTVEGQKQLASKMQVNFDDGKAPRRGSEKSKSKTGQNGANHANGKSSRKLMPGETAPKRYTVNDPPPQNGTPPS
jgi:energy-coupling factor transporter ATP-binding protein EcfA2